MRFGLLESITLAIQSVITRTDQQLILARTCNLLGDVFWLTGKAHQAILCHEKTDNIVINSHTEYPQIKRLHYSSVLNRGLCYLSLWEIDKAHDFFLDLKSSSFLVNQPKISYLNIYIFCAKFCLALTYSLTGDKKNTLSNIEQTIIVNQSEMMHYGSWTRGYSSIFVAQAYKNIRSLDESHIKYQEAIKFANDSDYPQVKAMALYGIGEIERINNELPSSLSYIQESVDILQRIAAVPDLAEAYFQLSLTYQAIGKYGQVEEYKAKAIELFEQMEAPKQCDRVNKAFEQGAIK